MDPSDEFGGHLNERRVMVEIVETQLSWRDLTFTLKFSRRGANQFLAGQLAAMIFILGCLGVGGLVICSGSPVAGAFICALGAGAVFAIWLIGPRQAPSRSLRGSRPRRPGPGSGSDQEGTGLAAP